jgi:hypothetical protein
MLASFEESKTAFRKLMGRSGTTQHQWAIDVKSQGKNWRLELSRIKIEARVYLRSLVKYMLSH